MEINRLITVSTVKALTTIEENVDDTLISKCITTAQIVNLQPLLGEVLYKKLMLDFPNYTGLYKVLVDDYITPTLSYWTFYQSLMAINYRITNKSVMTKNSDNSNPVDLRTIEYLMNNASNNASFQSNRMIDFIKRNSHDIPEYYKHEPFKLSRDRYRDWETSII